jgi:hypothetical protein
VIGVANVFLFECFFFLDLSLVTTVSTFIPISFFFDSFLALFRLMSGH